MRKATRSAVLAVALLAASATAGCGADGAATADAGARPVVAESTPSPSPTRSLRPGTCPQVRAVHQRVEHLDVALHTCLTFDGYSDIQAVINTVRSSRPSVLGQLDPLTFRARTAGTAVLVVRTTREICTASATCTVHNPPRCITVTVGGG